MKNSTITKLVLAAVSVIVFSANHALAEEGEEVYNGLYKEHQIIPNTMAILCKTSGEDMVKDPSKISACIEMLAKKRHSSDAEKSREGLDDLNKIKVDQLKDVIAVSAAKGASVAEFGEKSEETAEINASAKTVNDVDSAAVNTIAQSAIDINNLSDLYLEQLKYLAISNIENIDKSVVDDGTVLNSGEDSASEAAPAGGATVDQGGTKIEEEEYANAWIYKGEGVCEFCIKKGEDQDPECRQEACPDGVYQDQNSNLRYDCKNGECTVLHMDDVIIDGDVVFNASDRLGWQLENNTCEYCYHTEKNGVTILACDARACPTGNFQDANDDSIIIKCENGTCEKIDKE